MIEREFRGCHPERQHNIHHQANKDKLRKAPTNPNADSAAIAREAYILQQQEEKSLEDDVSQAIR